MTRKSKTILERLAQLERRDREKSEEIAKLRVALTMMQSDNQRLRSALQNNKSVREMDPPKLVIGEEWTTAKIASGRLGISVQAVGQRAKTGKLKHQKMGRRLYIECSQLPQKPALKLYSA